MHAQVLSAVGAEPTNGQRTVTRRYIPWALSHPAKPDTHHRHHDPPRQMEGRLDLGVYIIIIIVIIFIIVVVVIIYYIMCAGTRTMGGTPEPAKTVNGTANLQVRINRKVILFEHS